MARQKRFRARLPLFWSAVVTIVVVYLILVLGTPLLTTLMVGTERWIPMPRTLLIMFIIVVLVGIVTHVTTTDKRIEEFKGPVLSFLRGDQDGKWPAWARWGRLAGLIVLPILLGGFVYTQTKPSVTSPTALRIQHPTIPGAFEKASNPFRNPDGTVKEIKVLEEGRVLYQKNCRPCHGTTAGGDGPMARGFRLRPINFRDPGTIATLVEGYLVWRIKEGGPGLPPVSSPADSAMPSWKEELKDEEVWKIILAEYETAGVEPRKPEKLE
ncbi:MAG: cytochrome c [Deltaproteobacteria bacterium]|nr:cytochrome c [Deltaproteobacteria bacterium]